MILLTNTGMVAPWKFFSGISINGILWTSSYLPSIIDLSFLVRFLSCMANYNCFRK